MQNIVIGIFGLKGSGKTLLMVLLLYIEYKAGKKILVNMKGLNFPTEIIKLKELIKLSPKLIGCSIGIDELHTVADSRKSHKKQNINTANFIAQSRHRGVNVVYTDQFQNQDDKRIRQNTDIKIIARNLYIDSDNDGIYDQFEYTIIDMRTEEEPRVIKIYGKPVFALYSDAEIIDLFEYKEK